MKSVVVSMVSTFLLICGGGETASAVSVADVNQRLSAGQPTRIVCFGDSITGVYYHTGGLRAWCDMLGFALQKTHPHANLQMLNAGISGHTTVNALARIEKDVIAAAPHLVVVMFGMNDVTRVPPEEFRANMRTISQKCLDAGSAVVLCTPNSVYDNPARPEQKLALYAQIVREVASDMNLPLVDCFQDWQTMRQADPAAWALLMSDEIHPNMSGHIRFAELMATVISGQPVSLKNTAAPFDGLHHTFGRLSRSETVRVVAMPPWDRALPELLKQHFPDATFEVTTWPVSDQSVAELAKWGQRIRGLQPDLVVPAIPLMAPAETDERFVRDFEWVLNWSFQFGGRPWDVVPVAPAAKADAPDAQQARAKLARDVIAGKDVRFVESSSEAEATPEQTMSVWISEQKRAWQGTMNRLPPQNDSALLPAQAWPQRPGPRRVRTSIYYPGGRLENVNAQTGVMLTLHNWGGEDCVGTASPTVLADQLNVIAICVNYLQSGRHDSIDAPEPYDFGYLQALDALRSLGFVRNGLKESGIAFDDGRLFCTGGSGGGNVTLMSNKLAPRTFACVIDLCGMKKLSDDIAFGLPGGSGLNARWSRDPTSSSYLTADEQWLRFVGAPDHLQVMKSINAAAKIIVVHGVDDATCPFPDAEELAANLQSAELDVEPHFISTTDLDGRVFTSSGHALGNRTEIVLQLAGQYLRADSPEAVRRSGPCDFEIREDIVYPTPNGRFVISWANGLPEGKFVPAGSP